MKVADLFLKLSLDGAGDVSKGLNKVSGSLKELFSMSIQTKLTLAGIVAGLTGAAFSAGKTGKDLMQFKYAFDLSTKEMQKFSWATRQFGVDSDEAMGYIEGLQGAIADALQGGGYAQTFTALGIEIKKGMTAFDVANQIAERARGGNVDYYRRMGDLMSPAMVAANRRMAEQGGLQSWMNKTPSYVVKSEKQIEQQARIALAFENFSQNLKSTMENFIAKNEPLITKLITGIESLLQTLLNFISQKEGESGLISDVVKGDNVAYAGAKAAGRGILATGNKINEAVFEGGKALWETLKAGAMENEANRILDNAKRGPAKKYAPEFYEVQEKGQSTFYNINDLTVMANDPKEFSDKMMLQTHNQINRGTK